MYIAYFICCVHVYYSFSFYASCLILWEHIDWIVWKWKKVFGSWIRINWIRINCTCWKITHSQSKWGCKRKKKEVCGLGCALESKRLYTPAHAEVQSWTCWIWKGSWNEWCEETILEPNFTMGVKKERVINIICLQM